MDISEEQAALRRFAQERDWEQFHTPKNLVMALTGEVGELTALFQWLTPNESLAVMSSPRAEEVREEVADVAIYLLRLTDTLNIDLSAAVADKLQRNGQRYTVEKSFGSSAKQR